mmetsp:Transcript_25/g.45  ORF Transcript_25/g.45 Transcript_25/m.45 type:complete len:309 (-) Transcript_25:785-1711(-)
MLLQWSSSRNRSTHPQSIHQRLHVSFTLQPPCFNNRSIAAVSRPQLDCASTFRSRQHCLQRESCWTVRLVLNVRSTRCEITQRMVRIRFGRKRHEPQLNIAAFELFSRPNKPACFAHWRCQRTVPHKQVLEQRRNALPSAFRVVQQRVLLVFVWARRLVTENSGRMILEIQPDSWRIHDCLHSGLFEFISRPDSRKHQQLRRGATSCRQYDLSVGVQHDTSLFRVQHGHTYCAFGLLINQHFLHQRIRKHSQIASISNWRQIRRIRRLSHSITLRHLEQSHAFLTSIPIVEIRVCWNAQFMARLEKQL